MSLDCLGLPAEYWLIGGGSYLDEVLPQKYKVVLLVGRKEGCLVQFPFANRFFFCGFIYCFCFRSHGPRNPLPVTVVVAATYGLTVILGPKSDSDQVHFRSNSKRIVQYCEDW